MNEQVLAALARYGEPALFVIAAVASVGVPLPVILLLIIAGSLTAQGTLNFWMAVSVAAVGSATGDQIGYAIGRWGGKTLNTRLTRMMGSANRIAHLNREVRRWGGAGVFLSRWLLTPLGPWVNFASGAAEYSWIRFTLWDTLGEAIFASLYIAAGLVFSDRVQEIGSIFGDLTWALVGILAAAVIGWKLFLERQPSGQRESQPSATRSV